MSDLKFKPEDFEDILYDVDGITRLISEEVAKESSIVANRRLAELLKDAPIIYKANPAGDWFENVKVFANKTVWSHKAMVVCIEELGE